MIFIKTGIYDATLNLLFFSLRLSDPELDAIAMVNDYPGHQSVSKTSVTDSEPLLDHSRNEPVPGVVWRVNVRVQVRRHHWILGEENYRDY